MVLPLQKYAQPLETAKTIDHCRDCADGYSQLDFCPVFYKEVLWEDIYGLYGIKTEIRLLLVSIRHGFHGFSR